MAKTTKSKAKSSKKAGAKAPAKTKKKAVAAEAAHAEGTPKAKKTGTRSVRRPLTPKTPFVKWGEGQENWRLIDASGQTLGRLSSYIATALMGKDKASYTRHADTGDHVVVINAKKVVLTGNKLNDKTYYYHTQYPGGIKSFTAKQAMETNPERLIERAVYGMLPKGHMGRRWYAKLRVYPGAEHPHTAQQPKPVTLPDLGSWER